MGASRPQRRSRVGTLLVVGSLVLWAVLHSQPQVPPQPAMTPAMTMGVASAVALTASLGIGFVIGVISGSVALQPSTGLDVLTMTMYIASDVGLSLATAVENLDRESALIISSVGCIMFATAAAWHAHGWQHALRCLDPRLWLRTVPIAACFSVALWCQLAGSAVLAPVIVKVILQLKLPATVLVSVLAFRRSYSTFQFQALAVCFLSVSVFTALETGGDADVSVDFRGVVFCLTSAAFNVLAGLLVEKAAQGKKKPPIYELVAHLKIGEMLVFAALGHWLGGETRAKTTYDMRFWLVVGLLALDSTMAAMVVHRLSSVAKVLGKGVCFVALFVISLLFGSREFSLMQMCVALVLVTSTALFNKPEAQGPATSEK